MGVLHNMLLDWRSNQAVVEQLLDPAMRPHHINLLLLELKLIDALPKAKASQRGMLSLSSKGLSFRERLSSKNIVVANAGEGGSPDKLESGPVVSFLVLLSKATATKASPFAARTPFP